MSRRVRTWIDRLLLTVATIFAVRWVLDPEGNFEPIISLCLVLVAAADYFIGRRDADRATPDQPLETTSVPTPPPVPKPQSAPYIRRELPQFTYGNASSFFSHRFAQAFPGLRETRWYERSDAVERLCVLLSEPLRFRTPDEGWISPVWWFGRGNLSIDHFEKIDAHTVLLRPKEIRVSTLAAVYSSDYKRQFVYLEAEPMVPVGVYDWTPEKVARYVKDHNYAWEEYGLYKGMHAVTRSQYDDGATSIMGKLVNMGNDVELRVRYITKYNMLIAAADSPINNSAFDADLDALLNRLLSDRSALSRLASLVNSLPRNAR